MKNTNKDVLSIVVHPQPIIEMQIKNFKMDDVGITADCILYNKDRYIKY
jgi:hypothetical protein